MSEGIRKEAARDAYARFRRYSRTKPASAPPCRERKANANAGRLATTTDGAAQAPDEVSRVRAMRAPDGVRFDGTEAIWTRWRTLEQAVRLDPRTNAVACSNALRKAGVGRSGACAESPRIAAEYASAVGAGVSLRARTCTARGQERARAQYAACSAMIRHAEAELPRRFYRARALGRVVVLYERELREKI